jgi:thioredoxin-dependent peroxiredoxin
MLEVGNSAPVFSLPNQDGDIVNLNDFAGNWVLLWWYPKASTPG